jgi:hypothetical protein
MKHKHTTLAIFLLISLPSISFAQNSKGNNEKSTEEEELKQQLIAPSVLAPSIPDAIQSNNRVQMLQSGIDASTLSALSATQLNNLQVQLTGSASERIKQLKTLVNLVDVYSNSNDQNNVGRRAINTSADINTIISSIASTITADHLDTLSNLDTTQMSTFANDGISNIDNFAARVDVTSALLGDSIATIDATNLTSVVTNLHNTLDADSLVAFKAFKKTDMVSLIGTGDKKINLTASFDATVLKKTVRKFATKAESTFQFAKKTSGSADISSVDLTQITANVNNFDSDMLNAIANFSSTQLEDFAIDVSAVAEADLAAEFAHFAGTAELVVSMAEKNIENGGGAFATNDDGTLIIPDSFDFAAVVTVGKSFDKRDTQAFAIYTPEEQKLLLESEINITKLRHAAGKAEVGASFKVRDGDAVSMTDIINAVKDYTTEDTDAFRAIPASQIATHVVGTISLTKSNHVAGKAKKLKTYVGISGISDAAFLSLATGMESDPDDLENLANSSQADLDSLFGANLPIGDANTDRAKGEVDGVVKSGLSPTEARNSSDTYLTDLKGKTDGEKEAFKNGTSTRPPAVGKEVDLAADQVKALVSGNEYAGFQQAMAFAITAANLLLTDRTITTDADIDSMPGITLSSLSTNGYNSELIRLLIAYEAIGSKGSQLANAVLGSEYTSFNQSISLGSKAQPNTSYYQQFLVDLGARALGPTKTNNSIFSVPTANIDFAPAAQITFNSGATIDTSEVLPKDNDRRIAIIGAAKDVIIKGDLTINNTNTSENGVLVLGTADDLHLRSEYSNNMQNPEHYTGNPDVLSITNAGANLAFGSDDTMRLVNVSITTGGNLAMGTLDEMHIGTDLAQSNTFSVGTGGVNSDPDDIYMYASNLIKINGLNITGRVDNVYMEAITINLKNVNFPASSDVTLRSRDGTIGFNQFNNPIPGGVNLTNVTHGDIKNGSIALDQSDFAGSGAVGYWASNKLNNNGTPMIQVKKF